MKQGKGRPLGKATGNGQRCKKFIIDQVNPKFIHYDRPFTLALLVGGTTLVLTANIFVLLWFTGKETISGTYIRDNDMKKALTGSRVACTPNTAEMVVDTMNGGQDFAFAGPNNYQFVRAQTCVVDFGTRCVGFQADVEASSGGNANFPECGLNGPFPNYDQRPRPASGEGRVGLFVVELEMYPDPFATVGAALGYAGTVELLATICFTFLLSKCGCLSGGDKSYMSIWVRELVSQLEFEKADALTRAGVGEFQL